MTCVPPTHASHDSPPAKSPKLLFCRLRHCIDFGFGGRGCCKKWVNSCLLLEHGLSNWGYCICLFCSGTAISAIMHAMLCMSQTCCKNSAPCCLSCSLLSSLLCSVIAGAAACIQVQKEVMQGDMQGDVQKHCHWLPASSADPSHFRICLNLCLLC